MRVIEEVGWDLGLTHVHDMGVLRLNALTCALVAIAAHVDLRRVRIHCKGIGWEQSDRLWHHTHRRLKLLVLVIGNKHPRVRLMPFEIQFAVLIAQLQMLLTGQFTSAARTRRGTRRVI